MEFVSYDSKWLPQLRKIAETKLSTSHNVFQWNSYIERILKPRNLMHHLLKKRPIATNSKYFQWMNADSILFSWLLDSIKPDIVEFFRYEKTCKEISDKVNPNFSKKEDDARIYELLIATTQTNQGSKKAHEYANDPINLWRELDFYRPPTPNSLDRDCILRDRVFFFLLV